MYNVAEQADCALYSVASCRQNQSLIPYPSRFIYLNRPSSPRAQILNTVHVGVF
jgi:hypothetical protein